MSSISLYRIFLMPALVLVLGNWAPGQSASAAPGARTRQEPQALSNQQLVNGIQLLQSINFTLKAADHDYGGHRAQAVRAVGTAERQLRRALNYRAGAKMLAPSGISLTRAATLVPIPSRKSYPISSWRLPFPS